MNIDLENRINGLIAQEQNIQQQLLSVQQQKTRLQTVLQVWNECSADPTFYGYVAQVTENFKTIVPEPIPEPPAQTEAPVEAPVVETTEETTEPPVESATVNESGDQTAMEL
jgi:hypothetical protein